MLYYTKLYYTAEPVNYTPDSHSKNSLSKICSKGWVALQGNAYTICAKNFQGLGPKRPESWIANWVYVCLCRKLYACGLCLKCYCGEFTAYKL